MANQGSLLVYLQQAPPSIVLVDAGQSKSNITNANYGLNESRSLDDWADFNIPNRHPATIWPAAQSDSDGL
ncbi:hypothetical protein N7491_003610 [Penicillium cf. griseofulvum]|uniref:Uncharacterized protein n=1 Tax=Penicillium cf. griseofulvum TaxID=2972120 RepID=A0A9W9MQV3_9EURO|nr:hypothetical protein N7472_002213 [Penicillium cf. griseofulvum]KAJ5441204.1 hypothetical protein N7491_003610 [Penicillium cf. griseofulvum]KAJ5449252.1 hypothetical protein N7445_004073 [Penicillium cf. griseofulvum]